MGLPSGTQWANCNVGAEKPNDPGLYFSWGNIEGHAEGSGYDFSQEGYEASPAASIDTDLSLSQDAARASLGGPWRMPTAGDFQELCDNCTIVRTTLDGVYGFLFTSNLNGKTIFLPAAGGYDGTTLVYFGTYGNYWSGTYVSGTDARYMFLKSGDVGPQDVYSRRCGFSVRPVYPPL